MRTVLGMVGRGTSPGRCVGSMLKRTGADYKAKDRLRDGRQTDRRLGSPRHGNHASLGKKLSWRGSEYSDYVTRRRGNRGVRRLRSTGSCALRVFHASAIINQKNCAPQDFVDQPTISTDSSGRSRLIPRGTITPRRSQLPRYSQGTSLQHSRGVCQ